MQKCVSETQTLGEGSEVNAEEVQVASQIESSCVEALEDSASLELSLAPAVFVEKVYLESAARAMAPALLVVTSKAED